MSSALMLLIGYFPKQVTMLHERTKMRLTISFYLNDKNSTVNTQDTNPKLKQ